MNDHPSKDIIGSEGIKLKGKKIVLCITGSVSALKAPEAARLLMRHGAEVYPVMSHASQGIIHPDVVEWATGNPVVTQLSGKIEHIALAGERPSKADLILVAPATANTISKMACGIDDTPVTSVLSAAFGSNIPIIVVPAMHECMYRHPVLVENIRKLRGLGVEFVEPQMVEGKAKIADNEVILDAVIRKLTPKDLRGIQVLVTAGPTLEYLDPVRIITNKSSGKMGVAVAAEASRRGAEVTIVCNPEIVTVPLGLDTKRVETTREMYDAVEEALSSKEYDVVVAAAAAADYMPAEKVSSKIATKENPEFSIRLKATPKIIESVKKVRPSTFLVAFKAEHGVSDELLIRKGMSFLEDSKADLLVLNDVGRVGSGFRVDTDEVFIMDRNGDSLHLPMTSKSQVAAKMWDKVVTKLGKNV